MLMASGSEVELILSAAEKLETEEIGTRVVSFPSWELFEAQSEEYKENVLPRNIKARVSVEAGVKQGWEKYVGDEGVSISIERFGSSAPYKTIFENYGFTADSIYNTAKELI